MVEEPIRLSRHTAASGKIDYGKPVVLRETPKTKVQVLAWYITHTNHTETQIKIECFRKSGKESAWTPDGRKSLTLTEEASRRLLASLPPMLGLAEEDTGHFIAIRTSGGVASSGAHSTETVAKAILGTLAQPDFVSHLSGMELGDELGKALRHAIHLKEMRDAISRLNTMLACDTHSEQDYQEWCDRHFWAFGNGYVVRDDVRRMSRSDQADAILKRTASGFRDIIELKLPSALVIRWDESHAAHYFGAEVSKAIGQCHRYLDVFSDEARTGLRDRTDIVAYHPRAIIVVGRSNDWTPEQEKSLHGLNTRLHGITIMTYDHLLQQAERLVEIVTPVDPADAVVFAALDDEIPF